MMDEKRHQALLLFLNQSLYLIDSYGRDVDSQSVLSSFAFIFRL